MECEKKPIQFNSVQSSKKKTGNRNVYIESKHEQLNLLSLRDTLLYVNEVSIYRPESRFSEQGCHIPLLFTKSCHSLNRIIFHLIHKLTILKADPRTLLNQRDELLAKCPHKRSYYQAQWRCNARPLHFLSSTDSCGLFTKSK